MYRILRYSLLRMFLKPENRQPHQCSVSLLSICRFFRNGGPASGASAHCTRCLIRPLGGAYTVCKRHHHLGDLVVFPRPFWVTSLIPKGLRTLNPIKLFLPSFLPRLEACDNRAKSMHTSIEFRLNYSECEMYIDRAFYQYAFEILFD